jgi:hypothetical protein
VFTDKCPAELLVTSVCSALNRVKAAIIRMMIVDLRKLIEFDIVEETDSDEILPFEESFVAPKHELLPRQKSCQFVARMDMLAEIVGGRWLRRSTGSTG